MYCHENEVTKVTAAPHRGNWGEREQTVEHELKHIFQVKTALQSSQAATAGERTGKSELPGCFRLRS